jgi:uncharacterized Zn finger protein
MICPECHRGHVVKVLLTNDFDEDIDAVWQCMECGAVWPENDMLIE